MLMPAGRVDTNDGRWFDNNNPDGVVQAFRDGGLDLPFDFEHGSEINAPMGQFSPAAGWIVELDNRDGAIWGRVDWTERGRAAIEAKEVKYVSPAFNFDWDTMVVTKLSSAALTVRPAISTLPAIASRQTPTENLMDKKALCAALGLAETATEAEILAAINANKALASQQQQPTLDKFVPRADYDLVVAARDTAQTALASRAADELKAQATAEVEKGIADGKIAPASKAFYLATCATKDGLDKFKAFLTSAPAIVKSKADAEPEHKGDGVALASEQSAVAKALGMTAELYGEQVAADTKGTV